MAVFRVGDM